MGRFRIKIISSWFSKDIIVLRYSTNGIFWKSVKCCKQDILSKWYYIKAKTSHFDDAKHLLQKFNTFEKVKQYEANELARLRKLNTEITERRRRHKENRKNAYKQYG